MRPIHLSYAFLLLITVMIPLSGCIHTYPEPTGEKDPTLVDLIVEADISSEWGNLTDTKGGFSRRIIAVLTKNGKQSFRKT